LRMDDGHRVAHIHPSWRPTERKLEDRNSKSKGLLMRGLFAAPAPDVEIAVGGNVSCPGIGVEGGGRSIDGPSKASCTGGNHYPSRTSSHVPRHYTPSLQIPRLTKSKHAEKRQWRVCQKERIRHRGFHDIRNTMRKFGEPKHPKLTPRVWLTLCEDDAGVSCPEEP
jgi:hypothetical protein